MQNLANKRRLDARNALDSTRGYWIRDIRSDPTGDRLYLEIQSRELGGIWQYTPADKSFKQVVTGHVQLLHWSEGKLLFEHRTPEAFWHLLDPHTCETTALPGYTKPTSGLATIKVGPYLIDNLGNLHTNDGKIHRFPISEHGWEVMMPIPNGFVAAEFDDRPVRVWKFQLGNVNE